MKLKAVKNCTINGVNLKAGQLCEFTRPVGKAAIIQGFAIQVLRLGETPDQKPVSKPKPNKEKGATK